MRSTLVACCLLGAVATNAQQPQTIRGQIVTQPQGTKSSLWLLSVGVSQYRDNAMSLRYADEDAKAIAATLSRQKGGRIYRDVNVLVLINDQVTRASIMNQWDEFLGRAGPDDLVVIFLAGHGQRDASTGSYYFLPYDASADNLKVAGLRMTDFDEMVSSLRKNVPRVVLLLDTCYAGAVGAGARSTGRPVDLGAQITMAEGLFKLAAAKEGEESKEDPQLRHGVFTSALLRGLAGEADHDRDGIISLNSLFSYVAREVPRFNPSQHPYQDVRGTDLPFAEIQPAAEAEALLAAAPTAAPLARNRIRVLPFRNQRSNDRENDWMSEGLWTAFNTALGRVEALDVDVTLSTMVPTEESFALLQRLGIGRVVSGEFRVLGDTLRIDGRVINTATRLQEVSESVRGNKNDFDDLVDQLTLKMMKRLLVDTTTIAKKPNTNNSIDAYRLLLQAEGVAAGEVNAPAPTPETRSTPVAPKTGLEPWRWLAKLFERRATAQAPPSDTEHEIRQVLEEYQRAYTEKNLDRLAALFVSFPDSQRAALRRYLDHANELKVKLEIVKIESQEGTAAVTYVRRDEFVEEGTGKNVVLEVRLKKTLVRDGGQWKIAGGA